MARRGRPPKNRLDVAAEAIGTGLGRLAARIDRWNRQRAEIIGDIRAYLAHGEKLLSNLEFRRERSSARSRSVLTGAALPLGPVRARRKRRVSAAVRARLSRLAKARWAKAKKAGKNRLG